MSPGDGKTYASGYVPLDAPERVGTPLASWIQRAGAFILDLGMFIVLVATPVTVVMWFLTGDLNPCYVQGGTEICDGWTDGEHLLNRVMFWSLTTVFVLVVSWFVGAKGQTLGKKATACRVVDGDTEESIGFRRGLVRTLSMVVSAVPLGLGFLWPLWDDQNRTFHDMIARTHVISP